MRRFRQLLTFALAVGVLLSAVAFLSMPGSANDRPKRVEADFCWAVQSSDFAEVGRKFDAFAGEHALIADRSNPTSVVYRNEGAAAMLILRSNLGPHGLIVSYFSLDKTKGTKLSQSFENFVRQSILPNYKTIACADIPGFQLPALFR